MAFCQCVVTLYGVFTKDWVMKWNCNTIAKSV